MDYDTKGPTVLQTLIYWLDVAWRAPAPSGSPKLRDSQGPIAPFHLNAIEEPVLNATLRQENFNTVEFPKRDGKGTTTYKGAYGQEMIESFD